MPFAFAACATVTATSGRIVLASIHSDPARAWAMMPSSPSATSSTSGESGTIVRMTSASATASAMLLAPLPPALTSVSTLAGLRL